MAEIRLFNKYKIRYSQEWHIKCPTCGSSVTLRRPLDNPEKEPEEICGNCGGELIGFIYPDGFEFKSYVIDVNI
jgi:rRNA maturation endonuclease Nob1